MVPAPRGILAVGERAVGDLFVAERGDATAVVVVEAGETGFILRPLIISDALSATVWAAIGGAGNVVLGVGGRSLSRCCWRYAPLFWVDETGKAGVLPGDGSRLGRSSSDGAWMGRPRLTPLESLLSRRRNGTDGVLSRLAAVHVAAARVAGATEKRRPICTVALLSVLSSRRCRLEKSGAGFERKLKHSVTSVTDLPPRELRLVCRRSANFETRFSFGE